MPNTGIVELLDFSVYDTVRGKPTQESVRLFVDPFSPKKPLSETNMWEPGMFSYCKVLVHRLHCAFLRRADVLPTEQWPEGALLRFTINNKIYLEGSCWLFAHPLAVLKGVLIPRDFDEKRGMPRDYVRDGWPDWEKLRLLADVYNRPMDLERPTLLNQQEAFGVEIQIPGGWPDDDLLKVMVILEGRPMMRPVF